MRTCTRAPSRGWRSSPATWRGKTLHFSVADPSVRSKNSIPPRERPGFPCTSPSTTPPPTVPSARTMRAEYSATVTMSVLVSGNITIGFRR